MDNIKIIVISMVITVVKNEWAGNVDMHGISWPCKE